MNQRLIFTDAEVSPASDLTAIGESAQGATDSLVAGALAWPAHHARFTVSSPASNLVRVSPGDYYDDATVYRLAASVDVNLQPYYSGMLSQDERWIALILRGTETTVDATRVFETSEEPLTNPIPVNIVTPKFVKRTASIVTQLGTIGPAPAVRPTINEDDCCLAFVRVKSTGLQQIVVNDAARVKSVFEIEGRLINVEVRVERLFQETASIATDVAALAARLKGFPSRRLFDQLANDTAMVRQRLNFPDAARNYFFDGALVKDFWDFTHSSAVFRIKEGIRFQYTAVRDERLELANPLDPAIRLYDNRILLPAYDEAIRIESPVGTLRQDISNTVHTVRTAKINTVSHTSIRYGETVNVCENTAGWGAIADRKAGEIFAVAGETFVSGGPTDNPWNQTATAQTGHTEYAAQRVIVDSYESTYVTYDTQDFGLSGAIYGNTFLQSAIGVMLGVDLYATRVDTIGEVTLCLCEANADGSPDYDRVLATSTRQPNQIVLNDWTTFYFDPTLLEQGRYYAWFTVTTGNHQLACNSGNSFAGGTKFQCTDGIWSQGSTTEDFSFRLRFAKFRSNRTIVEFDACELTGGMTELTMIFKGWEPEKITRRVLEVKPFGDTEWITVDAREDNPLANLPAQVSLRMVLIGTEDVAPAVVMDSKARIITGRHRGDMVAVSKVLTFGYTTDTLQIIVPMDAYDPAHHTCVPKLIKPDGGVVLADSIVAERDKAKPSRTKFTANFDLDGTLIGSCRIRIDATTDDVTLVPFGQDVQLNAY